MSSTYGLPIADYQIATANQPSLLTQFQKTPQYTQDIAAYQSAVGKITSVDQFLGDYKTLKFALTAYNMGDIVDQKGLLKQLLTEDPTSSTSLAQKLGKQNYIAFAKAFWSLSTDGGAGISSQAGVNSAVSRYTTAQYRQWLADRDNDSALTTALNARQTLQDAVDVTDVGQLYAQYQKSSTVQATLTYYKNNISNINSVADLIADPKILNVALTAYGIDPTTISSDTVQKLLTQDPTDTKSVAAANPDYLAFANAFSSLNEDQGVQISITPTVTKVLDLYQQRSFAIAATTNTADQNKALFGSDGAAKLSRILNDATSESGLGIATSYYAAHIGAASTATAFAKDKQLVATAQSAYGLGAISADNLQRLLTEDPNATTSLAQTSPEYLAFAKAFSYAATLGPRTADDRANVTAVQNAYTANQLQSILQADVTQAAAQTERNDKVRENSAAPLDMYQILGDSDLSTVMIGAYNMPASVGALDPDQQVELFANAGFQAESLKSAKDIDSLIQRYMANVGLQNTPTSPILSLFTSAPEPGQIVTLDLSFLTGDASTTSSSGGSTSYMLNFLA